MQAPNARARLQTGPRRSPLKGCLIAAGVAALAFIVVAGIVVAVLFWKFRSLRDEFSDTELKVVPVAEADAEASRRLTRTYEQMRRAVQEGRPQQFAFTDLQINQMVATVPAISEARGRAHFTIVDDHLKVQAGIPLDQIPGFQGRFLNGEFTLDLRLENGVLSLHVLEASVRGQPLPPAIMSHLRSANLAEQAMQDPDVRRHMDGIKGLRIEGGKLIVETGR